MIRHHLRVMKLLPALLLALLPACSFRPRTTSVPLRTLEKGPAAPSELVVFLPGRWSRVDEFEREKFFEIACERWPDAKLVATDLHLGYYKNQSMARRLHEDVILPARRSGVKTVRFVGISMGGLGALIYDLEYPNEVDEMILLSPFVGEEETLKEIEAAGGLAKWRPSPVADKDFSRKLWLGLRRKWKEGENQPKVLLGCGREDRLAASNRLFAREFLKSADRQWITGDHDWPTWRPLFESLIRK